MALVTRRGRRRRSIGTIRPEAGAFNHFAAIAQAFPGALEDIVRETTEALGEKAVNLAPRRTGHLATSKQTHYHRRESQVISGRVEFYATDPSGRRPAHEYAFYVEVGTVDTPAQPFVVPAIMEERGEFRSKLLALESRLR